ncbi:MAG TPA: class I SAM-dependent methyltransferase [Acidisphaera sp.]|nr:class I SAM-dependent methyltransferase [Acidisphaera sp.]
MPGYTTDVPYTSHFYRELAPAWLDCIAALCGRAPPDRESGFAWCDLGCGQGLTSIVLAATHPGGRFVGVDLMPQHIAHARRLAADAAIGNVEFHNADFVSADLGHARFDYIVAHGVYAWIDAASKDALRRLIDRHLAPGGLAYLRYNAMPGWAAELPLQRLLLALAAPMPGDSIARFRAAARQVRRIAEAGAPSLAASPLAAKIVELEETRPSAYLAHEYLAPHWQPLFVTEVHADMAAIGLSPVGSATFAENFDSFVLRRVEREVLAEFDDMAVRELVRDFLIHRGFRRDVFSRDAGLLADDERQKRLLGTRYALMRQADSVEFAMRTPAGRLAFDNPVTRAIVAALAEGPRPLSQIALADSSKQDLIAGLLALCCGGAVRPVEGGDAPVAALNRAILERAGGNEEVSALALPYGTAVRAETALLRALRDGRRPDDADLARRFDFISAHC